RRGAPRRADERGDLRGSRGGSASGGGPTPSANVQGARRLSDALERREPGGPGWRRRSGRAALRRRAPGSAGQRRGFGGARGGRAASRADPDIGGAVRASSRQQPVLRPGARRARGPGLGGGTARGGRGAVPSGGRAAGAHRDLRQAGAEPHRRGGRDERVVAVAVRGGHVLRVGARDALHQPNQPPRGRHEGRRVIPNRLPRLRRAARLLALAPLLLAAGCQGRPRAETDESAPKLTASGHVAVVDLTRGAPESTAEGGLFPLPAPQTFVGLVRTLQSLSSDRDATAVFVTLGEARLGFAQSAEIGRLLAAVRDAGKSVVCHTHQIDNSSSWLLQHGCSEIWLSPAGDASTVGIAAQLSYLKGTFDRLGIEADMLAMGRYKSGAEPLTREGPSEPSAENLTATLRSIRDAWLDAVGKARQGRGATDAERQELLDALEDGPWTPTAARE